MPTHQCRANADAELSRVRVAVLGQPKGQQRNTALGRTYRLFTIFFGSIQRFTGCSGSPRFRYGGATAGASQSQSLHRVFSTAPARRSPDCQKPGDAELCAGPRCFCLYNSHHAIMVISNPWLQFTGHQPKRKRAELACTICHGKKVPIRVCLGRTWTEKPGRSDATSKSAPVRASATVPTATRPVKNVA